VMRRIASQNSQPSRPNVFGGDGGTPVIADLPPSHHVPRIVDPAAHVAAGNSVSSPIVIHDDDIPQTHLGLSPVLGPQEDHVPGGASQSASAQIDETNDTSHSPASNQFPATAKPSRGLEQEKKLQGIFGTPGQRPAEPPTLAQSTERDVETQPSKRHREGEEDIPEAEASSSAERRKRPRTEPELPRFTYESMFLDDDALEALMQGGAFS